MQIHKPGILYLLKTAAVLLNQFTGEQEKKKEKAKINQTRRDLRKQNCYPSSVSCSTPKLALRFLFEQDSVIY